MIVEEPEVAWPVLRVAVFEDGNADAYRQLAEGGLPLQVMASGPDGWQATFPADQQGVVTITLPGPGRYVISLVSLPGLNWEATSSQQVFVPVDTTGQYQIFNDLDDPLGQGEDVAFAFGLIYRRVAVWLPLAISTMLVLGAVVVVTDRRAKELRDFRRVIAVNR